MIQKQFVFEEGMIELPCGQAVPMPLAIRAMLRSAGVETLAVSGCCATGHTVQIPYTTEVAVKMQSTLATNIRNGGS